MTRLPSFFARGWKWLAGALLLLLLAAGVAAFVHGRAKGAAHVFRVMGPVPNDRDGFAAALHQSLGVRLRSGHHVSLLQNGEVFDALIERIGRAQSSVHLLMYIWEKGKASDRVVAALVARAKAGVDCRVLVDDFGSPEFAEKIGPALAAAGCEVRIFRPLSGAEKLARNHRKLLVVDGNTAITGGFGIRDNWLGNGDRPESWRDTSISFTGSSAGDAQQAFAENWQEAGGTLLPAEAFPTHDASGPTSAAFVASTAGVVTHSERLLQLMLAAARERIWIANAYFVPSRGILELLERKARAGVDVRILAPDEGSDSKTAFGAQHFEYGPLLKAGVKVWEYGASMMHAKTLIIDGELALVGSINLDPLSLNELEEAALVIQDAALVRELADDFGSDCKRSEAVRP